MKRLPQKYSVGNVTIQVRKCATDVETTEFFMKKANGFVGNILHYQTEQQQALLQLFCRLGRNSPHYLLGCCTWNHDVISKIHTDKLSCGTHQPFLLCPFQILIFIPTSKYIRNHINTVNIHYHLSFSISID